MTKRKTKQPAPTIKPIETYYRGYHFRSRLEARWAVFFDMLKLDYVYEPEGYVLSSGKTYLPDFWIPNLYFRWSKISGVWFEIKGQQPTREEEDIAEEFVKGIKQPLCMAHGSFDANSEIQIQHWALDNTGGIWWDYPLMFMKCPKCHRTRIQFCEGSYENCEFCEIPSEFVWENHYAIVEARSARFEFQPYS